MARAELCHPGLHSKPGERRRRNGHDRLSDPITPSQNIVKILLGRSQSDFIGKAAIRRQKLIVRPIRILAPPLF